MSWNAGAITAGMQFDVSSFTAGMRQVNTVAALFPSVVQSFLANPLLGVVDLAKQAASAIVGMFQSAANRADDAADLAEALGVNVTQLTALGTVAEYSRGSLAEVGQALQFLNRNASEAANGNKAVAATFAQIGIDAESLRGADPIALFMQVADAIKGTGSAADRTRLSMELMGRGGGWAVAMMKGGSAQIRQQMEEIMRLGGATTEEQAAAAGKWNDALVKVGSMWEGIKAKLMVPMVDALMPILQGWMDWFAANPEKVKQIVQTVANGVVTAVKFIAEAIALVANNLRTVAVIAAAVTGARIGSMFGPWGALIGAVAGGTAAYAATRESSIPSMPQNTTNNFNMPISVADSDRAAKKVAQTVEQRVNRAFEQIRSRQSGEAVRRRLSGG